MKPNRPSKGLFSQFDQIKRLLDEDESLRALARIILIILFLVIVIWLGSWLLPRIEVYVTQLYEEAVRPLETPLPYPTPMETIPGQPTSAVTTPGAPQPTPIQIQPPEVTPLNKLIEFVKGLKWKYMRLAFAPIIAFGVVLLAGASFLKDVYALPQMRMGLRYVITSMFGFNYPRLVIDGGKKQLKEGEYNALDKIGGPGNVVVQPGNAVLFNQLRGPSGVGITRSVFLKRFETIGLIVNLDEQHHHEDELGPITTKDGIKIKLVDVNYRFRVVSSTPRSLKNPYPFDLDAIRKMSANRTVGKDGISSWRQSVNGMIKSALINYINDHTIDYLTAPREGSQDPRNDMRETMMSERILKTMQNVGAELLWIDVGHIDIIGSEVDQERVNFWAADWVGSAEATRAFGEAKRLAYQEIGRAEAQAEMIMSIAHALDDLSPQQGSTENIRSILLARTAQIIDAMSENRSSDEESTKKKQDDKN